MTTHEVASHRREPGALIWPIRAVYYPVPTPSDHRDRRRTLRVVRGACLWVAYGVFGLLRGRLGGVVLLVL